MNRPSLTSIDAWGAHERQCLEVLRIALDGLPIVDLDESEGELNRRLYLSVCRAAREVEKRDGSTMPAIVPEGLNPPLAADRKRTKREFKRPDFYWAYHDPDGDEPVRQFVVECKRLTTASSAWIYTAQYVISGVRRFVTPDHGYGKQAWAGAMIGYVQRMSPDLAIVEVANHLDAAGLPALTGLSFEGPRVIGYRHDLDRSFDFSPFRLLHLWRLPST